MMQIEDVRRAGFAVKARILEKGGRLPERANPFRRWFSRQARLNHLLFLAVGVEVLCEVDKRDKAMRWLCFIQGALWAMGDPIVDMKLMNKPRTA